VSDNVRVMLRAGEANPRQRAAWCALWALLLGKDPQKMQSPPSACRHQGGAGASPHATSTAVPAEERVHDSTSSNDV
jgi:hypothetical protein